MNITKYTKYITRKEIKTTEILLAWHCKILLPFAVSNFMGNLYLYGWSGNAMKNLIKSSNEVSVEDITAEAVCVYSNAISDEISLRAHWSLTSLFHNV